MFDEMENLLVSIPNFLWNLGLFILAIGIGLLCRYIIKTLVHQFTRPETGFSFWNSLFSRMSRPLSIYLPILTLYILLPLMRMGPKSYANLHKLADIVLMITFAGLLMGVVRIGEDYVYHTYNIKKGDNLRERKIRTQLQFIRRLAVILIFVVTTCLILMSFDGLRKVGTSLLTGVGVGGIIVGFAAQKSLSSFLAGFQIAFTQPIRIDDVLIVEGEWGRVDEITLTYVVLKIWDKRNLVIPISYFIEKPFQNWTRSGSDLIGTVFIYLDYTVPLDSLRTELDRLLSLTPLWNKATKVLQVTDLTDKTIEVRALLSANNSSEAFDLRCYVREGLLEFVQKNYPEALPTLRVKR
jgi:small-conductance mechanosensitive channel